MNRRFLFPTLILGILCGCVSPPKKMEVKKDFEVPAQWQAGGEAQEVADRWWKSFESADLDALIQEALQRNPDLGAMAGRFEAAAANVKIAGADLYPNLGLGFDARKARQNFIGFPIPGSGSDVLSTRSRTYGLSLSSAWEVDLWGRVRAGKKAALADYQATAQDFRGARQSLSAQVAKAWINAIAARRQLDLAERTAANFRETADKIQFRYERGLSSSLNLRLAINSAENAEAILENRKLQYEEAIKILEILLGRYPSGKLAVPDEFPQLVQEVPVGLPSTLLERRPDLIAAERRLAAADQRLWQAKAALLPRISLTASGGTSSSQLKDLLDANFSVWSLAANLAQPLFEGGRLLGSVDLSKARVYEAANQYLSLALRAFQEVETALEGEHYLDQREGHLIEASRQADAALDLANLRYETGLEEFINVLESQRRALSDASSVIEVRRLRLENRVDLHLALGGGFPVPGETGKPSEETTQLKVSRNSVEVGTSRRDVPARVAAGGTNSWRSGNFPDTLRRWTRRGRRGAPSLPNSRSQYARLESWNLSQNSHFENAVYEPR